MWGLVDASKSLDVNSPYAYLLLCTHFADTGAVAERDGEIVAFVGAYAPPGRPDVRFVWQIVVAEDVRGRGLGNRLLDHVTADSEVRYLQATVTPSNSASWSLFRGFAKRRGVSCRESLCFPEDLFPGSTHEAETMVEIGPLAVGVAQLERRSK